MTLAPRPTALIADDEPLLREALAAQLVRLWPELQLRHEARNGREAVEAFEREPVDVAFLDVHMPGLDGVEAARLIGRRAHLVFVTAYEQYAVRAFEQGAIDYVVKPVDPARLADTVARLRDRLADRAAPPPAEGLEAVLAALRPPPAYLQWIRASVGPALRLIPVSQVAYLRSDEKYTLVAWDGGEALIRKTIRELAAELDPACFAQVHRSVIVNLAQVSEVLRGANETADIRLRGRAETLPVSRSYLHLFRQM